ncbi:DNA/RNA polymerases superfamily protein [Gossypium australe]|uniref:DNA/RNA polymerases superfamily protein n=1 Tax=Gossypium australe TaxID=47621 RepID=A0A5B6VNM2_9ROSI|nr:DNA/RNA polymerases superfamily protein [Gossypium australe]
MPNCMPHIVSAEGIRVDPSKISTIKDVKFKLSNKCQQSFDRLKALLTEAPVLVQLESVFDVTERFEFETAQEDDSKLQAKQIQCESTYDSKFKIGPDDCLLFRGRICIPKNSELVQKILNEAHGGIMSIHPGLHLSPKKKDAIWVIVDRLTKSTHFIPVRYMEYLSPLFSIEMLDLHLDSRANYKKLWVHSNWEKYLLLVEFAYNNTYQSSIKMAPYEALYWIELSEKKIHGVDLVRETEEKVKVGDKVFLKVSPWKKVLQFGHKGKLSPRFVGPYEIKERIGHVAYSLALAPELDQIHNVFHVSMLR